MKKIFSIVFATFLAACSTINSMPAVHNPAPKTTASMSDDFSDDTKNWRAKVADFVYPEVNHKYHADPVPEVIPQPYCYKTWDKPVCYTQPELGQDARLIGVSAN